MKKLGQVKQNSTVKHASYLANQLELWPHDSDDSKPLVKAFWPSKKSIHYAIADWNDKEELAGLMEYFHLDTSTKVLGCKLNEVYGICSENEGWTVLINKLMKQADFIASHKDEYGYKTIVEGEYNGVRFLLDVIDGIEGIHVKKKDIKKLIK